MLTILNQSKTENKNLCIHSNSYDTAKFIYGTIICADRDFFAVKAIAPDGTPDGIIAKRTDSVIYIETDKQYDEKIQVLSSGRTCDYNVILKESFIPISLLESAKAQKQIVSVKLIPSDIYDIIGFVAGIKDNICTVKQINEYGKETGMAYFKIEDITEVSYASQDELLLLKLSK